MPVQKIDVRGFVEPALTSFELDPSSLRWDELSTLAGLWLHYGRAMNLSGAHEPAALAGQIVEGLQVVALARALGVESGDRWLDVGSGAGFPGLVVASQWPVALTMVEPRDRRAGFLELALAAIKVPGRVLRGRVEANGGWRPDPRERGALVPGFRFVGARAVFPPARWLEVGAAWARPDGFVILHLHQGAGELLSVSSPARMDSDRWSIRAVRAADVSRGTSGI